MGGLTRTFSLTIAACGARANSTSPTARDDTMVPEDLMSHTITAEQAAGQLGELVRGLAPGDEIVLTDNDQPIARIVPSRPVAKRVAGAWKGRLTIVSDDE